MTKISSYSTKRLFDAKSLTYFFFFLAIIALAIVVVNASVYKTPSPSDLSFLAINLLFAFVLKMPGRFVVPSLCIAFGAVASLYDADLFKVILYEEEDSDSASRLKERIMILMQMGLLLTDNFTTNLVNFFVNSLILIGLKFSDLTSKESFYLIIYLLLYFFIVIKHKIFSKSEGLVRKTLLKNKEYADIFKSYVKKHSKTPLIILTLERRKNPELAIITSSRLKLKKSQDFPQPRHQTTISFLNDLLCLDKQYFLNLDFSNKEAREIFQTETNQDLERLLGDMIVFTEKVERTNGSSMKEKIGDLKEECYKIFNRCRFFSISKESFPSNIMLDAEYKFSNSTENSHFLINCFPLMYQQKIKLMIEFNNLSEKLEIERLKALDAYKDSIMANVTHDLRSPLQGFLTCIESLENKSLSENESLMLEIARSNIQMMSSLIQDILDDNQIKMGKIKLNLKEFKSKDFVLEVVNFMKVLAKEHNVSINSKINGLIHETIYSDPMRLKQVLVNLMNNSLKFTPKNGNILLEATVHNKKPKYLCFVVKDSGSGIPQDILDKLFKPYSTFQGNNGINKQGIGLGLTICQNIVSLLGPYNRILCQSEPGKGTKFWFYIYTEKPQFENRMVQTKMFSSLDESLVESDINGLMNFNLYSEFKIAGNMNSENSKLMKTEEEGSINEELEYVDNLSLKRPFKMDSDVVLNSPTGGGNAQMMLSRLVDLDLRSAGCRSYVNPLFHDPPIHDLTPRKYQISPPIIKKALKKQIKAVPSGFHKPRTFENIPNYSSFRARRGVSIGKKSPKDKASIFVKEAHSSTDSCNNKHVKFTGTKNTESSEISRRVIIIDDDASCRLAIQILVNKALENNCEIKAFNDGDEALKFIDNGDHVDMVFTDINMPGITGDQLAKKIKEKKKEIVIIGVSGMEVGDDSGSRAFDAMLTKPITLAMLNEVLEKTFNNYD